MASQITGVSIVCSTFFSETGQRNQSSAFLAFVRGIQRWVVVPLTTDQWRGKCFHLMTSSCSERTVFHRYSGAFGGLDFDDIIYHYQVIPIIYRIITVMSLVRHHSIIPAPESSFHFKTMFRTPKWFQPVRELYAIWRQIVLFPKTRSHETRIDRQY